MSLWAITAVSVFCCVGNVVIVVLNALLMRRLRRLEVEYLRCIATGAPLQAMYRPPDATRGSARIVR